MDEVIVLLQSLGLLKFIKLLIFFNNEYLRSRTLTYVI